MVNLEKKPSKTAEEVTLIRLSESQKAEDERICYDPLAIHFISGETLEFLHNNLEIDNEKEVIFKGVANSIAARVRYFDDFVEKCVDNGLEQLVILGAGYDTRAYRLECLKINVKVFEIDHPSTQQVKIEKIKEIFGSVPGHVEYIPMDFEKQVLDESFLKSGYDSSKKTLFLMEGLTLYIMPKTVDGILSFIVTNSIKGSTVIFDYGCLSEDINENKDKETSKNLRKFMKESGETMKFGLNEGNLEEYLAMFGFSDITNVTSEDYKKLYFDGKNKEREIFSLMSFAHAVVQ